MHGLISQAKTLLLAIFIGLICAGEIAPVRGQSRRQPKTPDENMDRLMEDIRRRSEADPVLRSFQAAKRDWESKNLVIIKAPEHLNPGETGTLSVTLRQLPLPVSLGGSYGPLALSPTPSPPNEISRLVTFDTSMTEAKVRAVLTGPPGTVRIERRNDEEPSLTSYPASGWWVWNVTPLSSGNYELRLTVSQVASDGRERQVFAVDDIPLKGEGDVLFYLGRVSIWIYVGLLLILTCFYFLWFAYRRGLFRLRNFDKFARGFVESVGNVELRKEADHRSKS